jgi:hypothetical protein
MTTIQVLDGRGQGVAQRYVGMGDGTYVPREIGASLEALAADVDTPDANTAAVVSYEAAGAGVCHVLAGVAWSYGGTGTLTGGNLQIADGEDVIFNVDITATGLGSIVFPQPKRGSANAALTITLAAGGQDISGKISVLAHWTE